MQTTCNLLAVILSAIAAILFCGGCSFGIEWQYHGQTGIDNRTQTELVRDKWEEESRKERR